MIRHDAQPKSQAARSRYDAATRAQQPARAAGLTGYRHDQERHEDARAKVDADRRREIAAAGGRARAATYGHLHPFSNSGALNPKRPVSSGEAVATRAATPAARAPGRTPAEIRAAAAARAAASRPARRAAQRAREKERQP